MAPTQFVDACLKKRVKAPYGRGAIPDTIQSGRETRLDDAAATPHPVWERVLPPGAMEVAVTGPEQGASPLRTTWHAWRRHVDLCRTSAALCRG